MAEVSLKDTERRCPQCWKLRAFPSDFMGARGAPVKRCTTCTSRYSRWSERTTEERKLHPRTGVPKTVDLRVRLYVHSKNGKLGGIPSSISSRHTCPPSCTFMNQGCYAEYHVLAHHWRQVGQKGDDWKTFCADVSTLKRGQLWRHNVAGDLPGEGDRIDPARLDELVDANRGRRGFTFTHKPVLGEGARPSLNLLAIKRANRRGFTVNLSADDLEHADRLAELEVAPVAVVLPSDAPQRLRTPAGRRVVVCPAQTSAALTCATCQLCALPGRKSVVGFRAHGQSHREVSGLVQLRKKGEAA